MRWLKHDTDARNDVRIKLLKKKFGAEAYGVYFQLLEIIGEHIENDNIQDWGKVDKFHTTETLAEECGVTQDKMRAILLYCNQLGIFEKKDGTLYCEKIKSRLDDYAERIKRHDSKKVSEVSTDIVPPKQERKSMDKKPSSISSILSKMDIGKQKESKGISTPWQDKAFRDMTYLSITLLKQDIGRVLKIYKEEANGNTHKATIDSVVSYLKDYPKVLPYEAKLNMFFKLITNGFTLQKA